MWSWQSDIAILEEIGAKIKRERVDTQLTQEELARQAGVSLATVRRLEGGVAISMRQVLMVMRALRMLDNLSLAFPDKDISPIQLLENHGKEPKRVRKTKS